VCSFIFTNNYAQTTNLVLNGKISNEQQEPLAFANVGIASKGISTVSNSSGLFTLKVPANYAADTVTISLVGYKIKKLAIQDFIRQNTVLSIILVPAVVELSAVVVKPIDARELLQAAVLKIPENVFDRPGVTKGFYRELVERDDNPIVLSEAAFDIYDYGNGSTKETQIKLVQKRSILDEKGTQGLEFGMSSGAVRDFDIVNHIDGSDILNTRDFKKYVFKYKGELDYNGTRAIAITFDQKQGVKESLYKGTIYLDENSLAFIAFDISRSTLGLKYSKYGSGKMRLLLKLMGISITLKENSFRINYRQFDGKWILSSVKTNTRLVFKSDRRQYDFICNIDGDYVNTEIDTLQNKPFDNDEVLSRKSFAFESDEPELLFWKDHNIILADYDEEKVIEQIQANNNAANIKKIIEQQISKLPKDKAVRIDSILSFYHQRGNFNGSALIKMGGDILLTKSYGLANRDKKTNFDDSSSFRIGSLSKSFTAMLIQQLHREGKLSLTDPLAKYIPAYVHKNITIEQLLTHTSGIPNFTTADSYVAAAMTKKLNPEEILFQFCSDTLDFQPGTQFKYSNSGYTALAAIIEKITGRSYGQAINDYIFIPLQMKQSGFGLDTLNTQGYLYDVPEPRYPIANMAGGGGISSTLNDLVKWEQALYDTSLLTQDLREEMFKPRSEYRDWGANYGYGWMIDRFMFSQSKKHQVVYHPGTDFGYYSMFARQPDKHNLIILLNNTGDFERFDMTDLILNEINR
jgi:CubicO group peptidase (beta-lactamase class C family)